MKLYVWVDPYQVSYGSSMVFAVANTVDQARRQAAKGQAYSFGNCPQPTPGTRLGKPTRIVELPCAEWHEWAE